MATKKAKVGIKTKLPAASQSAIREADELFNKLGKGEVQKPKQTFTLFEKHTWVKGVPLVGYFIGRATVHNDKKDEDFKIYRMLTADGRKVQVNANYQIEQAFEQDTELGHKLYKITWVNDVKTKQPSPMKEFEIIFVEAKTPLSAEQLCDENPDFVEENLKAKATAKKKPVRKVKANKNAS